MNKFLDEVKFNKRTLELFQWQLTHIHLVSEDVVWSRGEINSLVVPQCIPPPTINLIYFKLTLGMHFNTLLKNKTKKVQIVHIMVENKVSEELRNWK